MLSLRSLLLLLVGVLGSSPPPLSAQETPAPPNFLIIIGDDVGYDAFGCTGAEFARTPHVDQLASEGLVFDRFYGTVSQCGPIRAELYTGLFPVNNGRLANAKSLKKEGVLSMADHLAALGYQVGITGKTHFNLGKHSRNFPGFPGGANSSIAEFHTDGLKAFIEEAQAADRAFCAVIGSIHAHHPWDLGEADHFDQASLPLPEHWADTPGAREALARHAAEVEELDRQVGATMELLTSLKLDQDTVVIFLSEQGIAMPRAKWSVYDHGNRSLCVVRWPDKVAPRRTNALGQYCDILPTLVDLAGGEAPQLDGFSLRPVLMDGSDTHRDFIYLYNVHPTWQRTFMKDGWKLVWSPQTEREHIWNNFTSKNKFFSVPWAEWKALAETDEEVAGIVEHIIHPQEYELYRIDEDFYETHNLANEPENQERVQAMAAELEAFMNELGDPLYEPEVDSSPKKPRKRKKNEKPSA